MLDLLQRPVTQAVIWLAVLAFFVAVAVYGLKKLREQIDDDEGTASELLSKYREMHSAGGLSDAEFRTIKTALGARIRNESKDNGNQG